MKEQKKREKEKEKEKNMIDNKVEVNDILK